VIDGSLFFTAGYANQYSTYTALFRTDGTPSGTVILNAEPGPPGTDPPPIPAGPVAKLGENYYFQAGTSTTGFELWVSDGTAHSARLFMDIDPNGSSQPRDLLSVGDTLFFTAFIASTHGRELWSTDGTIGGTEMLADILPGTNSSEPRDLTELNGKLYFSAVRVTQQGYQARTLWTSGGRPENTTEVLPPETLLIPLQSDRNRANFRKIDGKMYFSGADNVYGNELWVSDRSGTRRVRDIDDRWGAQASSDPAGFVGHAGVVYFAAGNNSHGREVWRSDGTEGGTRLLVDLTGDSRSSHPSDFTIIGTRLFFTAETVQFGREIYVLDLLTAPIVTSPSGSTA